MNMANRFFSPNQQFFVNPVTGAPLAGGLLYFYASSTNTPQNTYSNSTLTIANSNPVVLDSNGYANSIFLSNLAYKVVLADSNNVQLWTFDPVWSSDFSTYAQFQVVSGNPNGQLAGIAGTPGTLPGSSVAWDSTNDILYVATTTGTNVTTVWTAVNPSSTGAAVFPAPGGRLSPVSATPVINTDAVSSTNLVYTPYVSTQVPIYNGTAIGSQTFAELTLTLTSSQAANTIYDVFVFNNSGVLTLVTGPAWSNSTAGTCVRGTGASTTQLSRTQGIWTNSVQITGRNGATTYTIGASLATYLGSIYIDGVAGQVTCHVSWGQNRKFGIWNAYNRVPIILQEGDATGTWTYNVATIRASNNTPTTYSSAVFNTGSGTSANGINVFDGLAEEVTNSQFIQNFAGNTSGGNEVSIGIGLNSTTAFSGFTGKNINQNSALIVTLAPGSVILAPQLGLNILVALETTNATTNNIFQGGQSNMLLQATYRG